MRGARQLVSCGFGYYVGFPRGLCQHGYKCLNWGDKLETQTPGTIQKVDPLIWGPILLRVLYRNPQ